MIQSIKDVGGALEFNGGFDFAQYTRPSVALSQDRWQDLSMASGKPSYNPYIGLPLVFTPLSAQGNTSIYVGSPTPPDQERRLLDIALQFNGTTTQNNVILCDYIGFYPLIDLASSDLQEMDNTDISSRYSSSEGVMMMMVNAVSTTVSSIVTYTFINDQDVEVTRTVRSAVASTNFLQCDENNGGVGGINPFMPLGNNCRGVKRLLSVQSDGLGDGFCNIVLVKPLAALNCPQNNVRSEVSFVNDKMTLPKIENGAFLNFICLTRNSATSTIQGSLTFIRG